VRDVCASRHRGNPESEAANERVAPSKADLRWKIMLWFYEHGPATCEQASRALGLRYTTASARLSELKADGFLEITGKRALTSGGSQAALLRAKVNWSSIRDMRRKPVQLELIER